MGRCGQLSFAALFGLTPVAFDEDPSTVAFSPVGGHPFRVRVRRCNIAAWDPNVTASVPAMVSADPHVSNARWRAGVFDNDRWRGNANYNLRERWRRSERTSEYSD